MSRMFKFVTAVYLLDSYLLYTKNSKPPKFFCVYKGPGGIVEWSPLYTKKLILLNMSSADKFDRAALEVIILKLLNKTHAK